MINGSTFIPFIKFQIIVLCNAEHVEIEVASLSFNNLIKLILCTSVILLFTYVSVMASVFTSSIY